MVAAADNRDLMIRRKRLGLTGADVATGLGLGDPSAIYHFEVGKRGLPHGRTRQDYEGLLTKLERKAKERKS